MNTNQTSNLHTIKHDPSKRHQKGKSKKQIIPAEEPTKRILLVGKFSETHLQTAVTSSTSAKPVRDAFPVDLPTPLISKVTALKPLLANPEAMPFKSPWQPPKIEYGWTRTIAKLLLSFFTSPPCSSYLGLNTLALSFTPSVVSTAQDSTE